jgi:hypothetical protein
MIKDDTLHRNFSVVRTLLIFAGGAIMASALFADRLGFGQPGGFGIGQLLLGLVGLFVLLSGLLGKKIVDLYRGLAIILLNTLVLVGVLELGAIVIARYYQRAELSSIQALPYYANQEWTETYWHETLSAEKYQYKPYVVWGHLPFAGETVNIDQAGIRQTPGADCSTKAYKVFMFGGSTMWGWGSPDWGTIPAYLQKDLDVLMTTPVCVVNLAEDGYVSTQSLFALTLQLQSGNVPDAVIFYSGVNDVLAAYESGQAGVHPTLGKMISKFEEREHPLVKWFKASRQYSVIENLILRRKRQASENGLRFFNNKVLEIDTPRLAESVTAVYLSNYRLVEALADKYGFDRFFFWQPHIAIGEKPLTLDEQTLRSDLDPLWADLTQAVYQKVASVAPEYDRLWYLGDVFDDQDTQIWIDKVSHVTPEGNRLVAKEMLKAIETLVSDR